MINKLITWLFFKVKKTHDERTFVFRHLHERDEVLLPRGYYDGLIKRSTDADFQDEKITALMDEINSLQEKLSESEVKYNKLAGKTSHIEAIRKNSLRK